MKTLLENQLGSARSWPMNFKSTSVVLSLLALALVSRAQATDNRAPDVPAALAVPDGNKVHFHAYGVGVQIYAWNATTSKWVFQAPEATLFDSDGNVVGTHFLDVALGLPEWESDSGSTVVGKRIAAATVDATAIPWLLLLAVQTSGPGIFAPTTYVQRVNTVGGLAPAAPGTTDGQVARVAYAAEYFFFRAE
jgi:hypothetical protein